jgi:hypothetical protein
MQSADIEWVLFHVVNDEAEAHILVGLLRARGLSCRMQSMRVPQYPLTVNGLGEIHIFVAKEDLAEARRVMAAKGPEE